MFPLFLGIEDADISEDVGVHGVDAREGDEDQRSGGVRQDDAGGHPARPQRRLRLPHGVNDDRL